MEKSQAVTSNTVSDKNKSVAVETETETETETVNVSDKCLNDERIEEKPTTRQGKLRQDGIRQDNNSILCNP